MTLPFRRRHHDAEATHDRARSLSSRRLTEPLGDDDAAWLARHLDACTECRREDEAFAADRELLRGLRATPIEPPRDLWARTSAALEREAAKRQPLQALPGIRAFGERRQTPAWRFAPAGALAAVAVVFVVVVSSVLPTLFPQAHANPSSPVAVDSGSPGATPFDLVAQIPVIKSGADGSWDIYVTDVDQVCPRAVPACAPPPDQHKVSTGIVGAKPATITLSPHSDQLVYETGGNAASSGKILVVPLSGATTPSAPPTEPPLSQPAITPAPPSGEPASPAPSPEETPRGAIEIASGVTVVGEVGYSPDGHWIAFSAAPGDGSTGPDLYLYTAGNVGATRVTDDHATYFSAWLGSQVLASHVAQVGAPGSSGEPAATDTASPNPDASGSPNPGTAEIDGTPSSFLLDPATLTRTELTQGSVWLPVVDTQAQHVVFWSGTLRSTDAGASWQLADGRLVLDRWSTSGSVASAAPATSGTEASVAPSAAPAIGPRGNPTPLVQGDVADFRAKFDPAGNKLAVWVAEQPGDSVGRIRLVAIDPTTGAASPVEQLPATPALRRFSIDANRLAWVSPPGQDGQESSLQVLGWNGDQFGEIQTGPAPEMLIIR
jgi:hypothetical protein